jgi:hypothetical protein
MAEQTVTLKLKVDDSGSILLDKFSGKLAEVPKHVDSMSRSLSLIKWDSIVNLAQRAFQAGERIYDLTKNVSSSANEIQRQAGIIGASTDQWQKWAYAAKMADVPVESLMTSMKFLSQNIIESRQEGSEANKIFKALGITGTSLDEVMYQLADTFSKTKDGEEKITYATKLMGRGAMEIIPYFNLGRNAIQKFGEEAQNTGRILSPELLEKGAKLDEQFKKFEGSIKAITSSFVLAAVPTKSFGDDIGTLTKKIVDFYSKPEVQKYIQFIAGIMPGTQLLQIPSLLAGKPKAKDLWESFGGAGLGGAAGKGNLTPFPSTKELPIFKMGEDLWKSFKEGEGVIKIIQGDVVEMIPIIKDYESWWDKINSDLDELRLKMKMVTPEGAQWTPFEPGLKPGMMEIGGMEWKIEDYVKLQETLQETKNLIATMGWEDYAAGLDASTEGTRKLSEMTFKNTKTAEDMIKQNKSIEDIGKDIANIWTSSFSQMRRSGESFSDWFKGVWLDMADYAIGQITKIAANYALFGNTKGTYTSGLGLLGFFGHAIGLQEGGSFWTRGPTPLMVGEGGQSEFVSVTPKSKMGTKEGGSTSIYFINPIGFDEALMRHMGLVVKGVQKNLNTAGGLARG